MSIIVTGASGSFGRQVAALLIEKISPSELILVTRNPPSLAQFAARGAQVRFGNFDDRETLPQALAGGERILLISTLAVGPRRQRQHAAAVRAAVSAVVKHIVSTSSVGIPPKSPSLAVAYHYFP